MGNRQIAGDDETIDILEKCKDEFRHHNPAFKDIPISNKKIIKEIGRVYLNEN